METLVKALFALVERGDLQGIGDLLKGNPELAFATSKDGTTPVLHALAHGRTDTAKVLAALRATPLNLFEAAALGDTARLQQILSQGKDRAGAFGTDGFSALHLAAYFGHPESVALLLAAGADANAPSRNPSQVHPLHSACACPQAEAADRAAELLLKAGADVGALQRGGFSALHGAAAQGNLPLVKRLLEAGADPNARAQDNSRPLDLAEKRGQGPAAAYLRPLTLG